MGKHEHKRPAQAGAVTPAGIDLSGTGGSVRAITRAARHPYIWAAGIVTIGALIGVLVYSLAKANVDERITLAFDETLTEHAGDIEKDVLALTQLLHSLQAFYDSSKEVERDEFATFVRGPLRRLPDVRGVAWAPIVHEPDREAFEQRMRETGAPDYAIHGMPGTSTELPYRIPLAFVQPVGGDELALGYDLGTHPAFRDALSRASMVHEPVLSEPFEMGSDPRLLSLLVLGVFKAPDPESTQLLMGYVALAFRPADLCERTLGDAVLHAQLSHPYVDADPLYATPGFELVEACCSRPVNVGSRGGWTLDGHPSDAFIAERSTYTPLLLAALAGVLWIVLAGGGLMMQARARDLEIMRQDETMRSVLESLGEGVVVFDRDGVPLFTNASAQRLFGTPHDLERSGLWTGDGAYLADRSTPYPVPSLPLVRVLRGEVVPEEDLFVRGFGFDGRWIGVSGAPLRGEDGEIQGGVLTVRDVTAQRRSKEQRVEMELAAAVQKALYPEEQSLETLDLAGAVFSADATCGDYYDFIRLSEDKVAIAIGDVSGHGLGPAMVMTQVRAYLRAFLQMTTDLAEVAQRVNKALCADLREEDFVTLLVAVLDLRSHRIEYFNAGHVPGYVLDGDGNERVKLEKTGMTMGVDPDVPYKVGDGVVLEKDDVAVFLTDGVIESRTKDGAMLWDEGALEIVRRHQAAPSSEIITQLYKRVRSRARSRRRKQEDDVTMVICKALAAPVVPLQKPAAESADPSSATRAS